MKSPISKQSKNSLQNQQKNSTFEKPPINNECKIMLHQSIVKSIIVASLSF
jgi:hypothetical protein